MSQFSFSEVPTLKLSDARDPATKPAFLASLRHALLNVGFLYISDTGIPQAMIDDVIRQCHDFFEVLSKEEKLQIEMKNEKSFLGFSRLGNEVTAGKADWREQLDLVGPCTSASEMAFTRTACNIVTSSKYHSWQARFQGPTSSYQ